MFVKNGWTTDTASVRTPKALMVQQGSQSEGGSNKTQFSVSVIE